MGYSTLDFIDYRQTRGVTTLGLILIGKCWWSMVYLTLVVLLEINSNYETSSMQVM